MCWTMSKPMTMQVNLVELDRLDTYLLLLLHGQDLFGEDIQTKKTFKFARKWGGGLTLLGFFAPLFYLVKVTLMVMTARKVGKYDRIGGGVIGAMPKFNFFRLDVFP